MPTCFQIHPEDNVATVLDGGEGVCRVLGPSQPEVVLLEHIERGHKVALRDIAANEAVIKFGSRIGHATRAIPRGAWVHLHNLASDLDDRSGTLDLHTGAPVDTDSAYA